MKTLKHTQRRAQQGVIILLMFVILFMAGASLFITYAGNNVVAFQSNDESVSALRDAKAALIAYAVLHGEHYGAAGAGPGHLPCPDTNGNGSENTPCGNNALGRLPQSIVAPTSGDTIQLSDFNYGVDQQLWYALANPARRTPVSAFNTTTATTHTLDGQTMVAVLISPGQALGSQSRPSNNRTNYLEGTNTAGTSFVTNNGNGPDVFNDKALGITVNDIMEPVTARVAETIKTELDTYHGVNGQYPPDNAEFLTAIATAPAWFATNSWNDTAAVTTYAQLTADTASLIFTGCGGLTYTLNNATGTITRAGTGC